MCIYSLLNSFGYWTLNKYNYYIINETCILQLYNAYCVVLNVSLCVWS